MQNKYRTHSFNICFWVYIVGEVILLLIKEEEFYKIAVFYLFICIIPGIIISKKLIKEGLFIFGSKKRKKNGIKKFRRKTMNHSQKYSNNENDEVLNKLKKLENKFDEDDEKKGVIKKLIDNLKALEVTGPETDIKKIKKDLIPVIIELLSWL